MNKKIGIGFGIFLIVLYSLTIYISVAVHPYGYYLPKIPYFLAVTFIFLSVFFTISGFVILVRNVYKKRQFPKNSLEYSKLFTNKYRNTYYVILNSILITVTIIISIIIIPPFFLIMVPGFVGYNILWWLSEYKTINSDRDSYSSHPKSGIRKWDYFNIFFVVGNGILFIFFIVISLTDPYGYALILYNPGITLFNLLWIGLTVVRKKGFDRDMLILKISLLFNIFLIVLNLYGMRFLIDWILALPFTIICIIKIVVQMIKTIVKKNDTIDIEHKEIIDDHVDIMKKLNGTVGEQR